MLTLLNYQSEAIDAVFDYWQEEAGNPLVDLATGCGKSLVMAKLIQRLIEGWPDMRVMVVTHVAELIEQNYLELLGLAFGRLHLQASIRLVWVVVMRAVRSCLPAFRLFTIRQISSAVLNEMPREK